MPYGSVVDVRTAIAQNSGNFPLIDALAGTSGEYSSGNLQIGTRLLCDFNNNRRVDLSDFAEMAADWGKTNGQYTGDITGPNGIPDGNVDIYDLMRFSDDWMKTLD